MHHPNCGFYVRITYINPFLDLDAIEYFLQLDMCRTFSLNLKHTQNLPKSNLHL